MVSLLNFSLLGSILLVIVIVQAKPLTETSNNIGEIKSAPINQQQLYELYKKMRSDPRLATISNTDLVAYINRNFVLGNSDETNTLKPIQQKHRRNRHQLAIQAE